jgi:hypothetical protein
MQGGKGCARAHLLQLASFELRPPASPASDLLQLQPARLARLARRVGRSSLCWASERQTLAVGRPTERGSVPLLLPPLPPLPPARPPPVRVRSFVRSFVRPSVRFPSRRCRRRAAAASASARPCGAVGLPPPRRRRPGARRSVPPPPTLVDAVLRAEHFRSDRWPMSRCLAPIRASV